MSETYSLICKETKKRIWIGQGRQNKGMGTLYSGMTEVMEELIHFLNDHIGKQLQFVNDGNTGFDICFEEYEEYTERDGPIKIEHGHGYTTFKVRLATKDD